MPIAKIMILDSAASGLVSFRRPLISALVAGGYEVVAVAPDVDGPSTRTLESLGATGLKVELSRTGMNPIADISSVRALEGLFRQERPDALLACTVKPAIWGSIAAHRAGVPRIVAMLTGLGYAFTQGVEPRRFIARVASLALYKYALRYCDTVIFQNPDDRKQFDRYGLLKGTKGHVVNGSGVELDGFSPAASPAKPCFLMLTRLLHDKGVLEYCRAAAHLKRRHPEISFRLAGAEDTTPSGLTRKDLDAWIAEGLEYLGKLDDVRPALAEASVYVLPSFYREGTPRSILEAMAMGRAIITTNMPGCRETVVEGENGFLVPPRDHEALAKAMDRFIVNSKLAATFGARSRVIAEAKYDADKVANDMMSVIVGASGSRDQA